jgi:hypothetical protein
MKKYFILIVAIFITFFGCKDNVIETPEKIDGIVTGKKDGAYFVSLNDTFVALAGFIVPINSQIKSYDLNNDGIDDVRSKVIGGGIMYIPANSTWQSESIGGIPHMSITITNPSGEITAKLAYEF